MFDGGWRRLLKIIAALVAVLLTVQVSASDVEGVRSIATKLLAALESPERGELGMVAITIDDSPAIYPRRVNNGIAVSQAYVEFMDKMAKALATDRIAPGYLKEFGDRLANFDGNQPLPDLPPTAGVKTESLDWQNAVATYFNHLVGNSLSIEYAHLYLGQYASHQKQLNNTNAIPLHLVLSDGEWQKALKNGVTNSSRSGFGITGLPEFYEFIESLNPRPAWSIAYFPPKAKAAKLQKELTALHDKALR